VEDLAKMVERLEKQAGGDKSDQDKIRTMVLENLSALGAASVGEDGIQYRDNAIVLPKVMEGNLDSAIGFLREVQQAEEEEIEFGRSYDYRPWDGAAAFQRAMQLVFGTSGVGKAVWTFFGKQLPQLISIPIGHDKQIQVPWGTVTFAPLDCEFELGGMMSPKGPIFHISVEAPRKYRKEIEGFLAVVADELKERSIYRGQAINAQPNPDFLDPYKVKSEQVVYSQEALTQLTANIWTVLDHSEEMRTLGQPLKRAVLLEGQYGTGKTMTGSITAQHAVENGWTFILVRAGDDPYAALQTAQIYAPAVVWIEDLDVLSMDKDRSQLEKLLDALDGVSNKGTEVMAGFTTNFKHLIDKAVLRPGRIDAMIHLGELDAPGFEQLIRAQIPARLLASDLDFTEITKAFAGYVPAFAVEAAGRAIRYSMARNNGQAEVIQTRDLVEAARGLRPQFDLQADATEAAHARPSIEKMIIGILEQFEVQGFAPLALKNHDGQE
jgi:transitional endoplasmic reticulum ATPase